MLKSLYDYGIQHSLTLPEGLVKKTIEAYVCLSSKTKAYVVIEQGGKEGVACPDIGSLANGTDKSNVLCEKRSVVLPAAPSAKNEFFRNAMKSAAEVAPIIGVCLAALEDNDIRASINKELDNHKIKASARISFKVDGISILSCENITAWWQEYRKQFIKTNSALSPCLITGQLTVPLVTTPPINGLYFVGGHGRGDALICFDKPAFCSYGLKQSANAPVSEEAFASVKAALDVLIADAPSLAGMKFVHWYSHDILPELDPLMNVEMGYYNLETEDEDDEAPEASEPTDIERTIRERSMKTSADALVTSVVTGNAAPSLNDIAYHILLLSAVKGRVMVRRYTNGSYSELQDNIKQWREDLALTNSSGNGRIGSCKLVARLIRLISYQSNDKDIFKRLKKEIAGLTPAILTAILVNGPLPDAVAARALSYIRSMLLAKSEDEEQSYGSSQIPDAFACQWLKAWLLRKSRIRNKEVEELIDEYNWSLSSQAYHCGGLMAVYAKVQMLSMPDVNASIVQRYYAAAIQTPALVIGRLSKLSNHQMEKIESSFLTDDLFTKMTRLAVAVGDTIPVTLTLEGQSYFALGYYQMWALLEREKNERLAAKRLRDAQAKENEKEN